jgi:hypothetical protein
MPHWLKPQKVKEAEQVRAKLEEVQKAFRSGTERLQTALAEKTERQTD